MQAQLQSQWCWAAVASSIAAYFDTSSTWSQCALVTAEFNQACCQNGQSSVCNQPWYLDRALTRVGHFDARGGPLAMAAIVVEIDSRNPLGARVGWAGGGGHFVVVGGYDTTLDMVHVHDQADGSESVLPYDTFKTRYKGTGSWTHSYTTTA